MKKIKLYWWRSRIKNFGDTISPIIVEKFTDKEIEFSEDAGKLVACGTVFGHVKNGDTVWGTGIADANRKYNHLNHIRIAAIRGPLSRDVLIKSKIECPEIYGDPAILLPYIYSRSDKKFKIGVVPHYVDIDKVTLIAEIHNRDVNIINILSGIKNVIHQITSCDYIFSSCLHGIITAEAYGIPACWVRFSDKIKSPVFKFKDYYKGTGRDVDFVDMRASRLEFNIDKCKESVDFHDTKIKLIHALEGVMC